MIQKIWLSWAVSTVFPSLIISLYICFTAYIRIDLNTIVWHIFAACSVAAITVPIPIIISIVATVNKNLPIAELGVKIRTTHIITTIILSLLEGLIGFGLTNRPTTWGNFGPLVFIAVLALYLLYSLFSLIGWAIVFRRSRIKEEQQPIDNI